MRSTSEKASLSPVKTTYSHTTRITKRSPMTKKPAEIFQEKKWQKAEARALSAERRLDHAMKRLAGVWDRLMTDALLPNNTNKIQTWDNIANSQFDNGRTQGASSYSKEALHLQPMQLHKQMVSPSQKSHASSLRFEAFCLHTVQFLNKTRNCS